MVGACSMEGRGNLVKPVKRPRGQSGRLEWGLGVGRARLDSRCAGRTQADLAVGVLPGCLHTTLPTTFSYAPVYVALTGYWWDSKTLRPLSAAWNVRKNRSEHSPDCQCG